ncbi:MAG: tRNA (adenosine(37)-N6)-threonylcarbamoyltransferase complex ATPase subunit type 1 TsaE [Acidimicrobiales bacterium]
MATATVITASAEATREVAGCLAGAARRGDVILLAGGLGAGKTTFAQGFARALGVEGPVTSPTFTLVRQYPCALGQLFHADVYRLEQLAEVADLGLGELVEDGGMALVEWGDVAAPVLGPVSCTVRIERPLAAQPSCADDLAGRRSRADDSPRADDSSGADDRRTLTVVGDERFAAVLP